MLLKLLDESGPLGYLESSNPENISLYQRQGFEIVGEIRDEYDAETEPIIDEGDATFVFSGGVKIDDVNRCFDLSMKYQGFETVGGYVLSCLGRVPTVGEVFETDEFNVEVLEAEHRRVRRVRLRRRTTFNLDK